MTTKFRLNNQQVNLFQMNNSDIKIKLNNDTIYEINKEPVNLTFKYGIGNDGRLSYANLIVNGVQVDKPDYGKDVVIQIPYGQTCLIELSYHAVMTYEDIEMSNNYDCADNPPSLWYKYDLASGKESDLPQDLYLSHSFVATEDIIIYLGAIR